MYGRSDTTDALGKDPGVARVATWQDQLDAAEHHTCTPGIDDAAILNLGLDAQVAFDARDRIDSYATRCWWWASYS